MNPFAPILESWLADGAVHRRLIKARLIKFVLNVRELNKRRRNASKPWQQNANKEPAKSLLDRKNSPELTKHNKTKNTPRDSNNSTKGKNVDDKKKSINTSCNGRKKKQPISSNDKQKKMSANVDSLKSKRQRELASRRRKSSTDFNLRKRLDNNRYGMQSTLIL
jgi:hypothetical protein